MTCESESATELRVRWEQDGTLAAALLGYDVHYVPVDIDYCELYIHYRTRVPFINR